MDELVLLEVLDLREAGFAFGTLEGLARQQVRQRRWVRWRGIDQVRGCDDGVDVGDVFLEIGGRPRSAEQLAAVGTARWFCPNNQQGSHDEMRGKMYPGESQVKPSSRRSRTNWSAGVPEERDQCYLSLHMSMEGTGDAVMVQQQTL